MEHLSRSQKLIYEMEKYAGGAISVICGSMLLQGNMDTAVLQAAANELRRINPALRTRIVETDTGTMQVVKEYTPQDVPVLRFSNKVELIRYAEAYARKPLKLYGQLFESTVVLLPDQCGLLVKLHHIISDAWTLALMGTQYNALLNGETPSAYSYEDHLQREDSYLQSERHAKDRAFFLEQFQTCEEVTYLSEKQNTSSAAQRKTFVIDKERTQQLVDHAKAHGCSAFVLFMTAFAAYFSRVKQNAEKFYVGTAVLNRSGVREKNTAGMFINMVPMLIKLENEQTFSYNLAAVKAVAFAAFRHQKFNYDDILSAVRQEYGVGERLYDVLLSYQNATITGEDRGIESAWYHCGAQTESLQIHIDDRDKEGIFRIHFDYQTEKFAEQKIERMYTHILNLLFDAVAYEDKKLFELEMLSSEEKQQLLYDFNGTAVDYPRDKCVHTLFEEQAAKTPDKTAVIACDCTLTYRKLNEQANRIAHSLINQGVKPGDIVAFALPRRSYLIAAMFGILKAGTAYLPIDPDYPQDRIEYMLEDSKAAYFITESNIQELLNNENITDPMIAMASDSLCYCIYTSGSTGKPKGTLLTHKNVGNYINNCNKNVIHSAIQDSYKTIVSVTTVGFDIFVTESILPLTNGMTIIFANEEQAKVQSALNSFLECNPADVLQTTPTKMRTLIADSTKCEYLMSLKAIILGGEVVDAIIISDLNKLTSAHIFNIYGPTETTVWSTKTEILSTNDITIGKPIANTKIYIVDKYLRPVPIGVTGELCIAGDGVGAGYLNRPDLTAEKFIDNPFGEGKLYKTGDLAFWREDGNIVYVGRNDFQVKIRGLRIELGEIENALQGVEGISQAVAVVRKSEDGRQLVCAFYTGQNMDSKILRTAIGQKLPKYMLPHSFAHLEAMPLTTSGKVNRKALPEVDLSSFASTAEYIPPVGEMEKRLATFMERTLNYSPVGRYDDFFDLGGDSLKAIEFVSKAHNDGIYFSLQSIFDHPTVKSLCEYIGLGNKPSISYADEDFTTINNILAKNCIEMATVPPEKEMGNLFLAGATGFLGIHILAEFLEHDNGIAYCLVRGDNLTTSEQRLADLLGFYFDGKYTDLLGKRIQVICGDLQKDNLGLTKQKYHDLQRRVDTVINAAASVKHYGSHQYFYGVNVKSTQRLIDFCISTGIKLIHISTLSVSGNSFADQFDGYISETEKHFYESDLYIGQPLENVYARSKFEAEKAVLDAMALGLHANIMRMGNLTNRMSDGKFQINHETNAAAQRIKGVLELGMMPDYLLSENMYMEFTPIDEAARAVMTIVRHFSTEQTVFHINSTKVVYLNRLNEYFRELGYPVQVVTGAEFTQALRQTAKQAGMEYIFEIFINDLDEQDRLNYDSNIHIENSFTEEYLKRLGFKWAEIGIEYLRKYAAYFERIGYWRE